MVLSEFLKTHKQKPKEDKLRGLIISTDGKVEFYLWSELYTVLTGYVPDELIDEVFTLVCNYDPRDEVVCLSIKKSTCRVYVLKEK